MFARVLFVLLASMSFVYAEHYAARAIQVPDGDTIQVARDGRTEWIRLNGVDCPESGDPYTTIATETARELFLGKLLSIHSLRVDAHHRIVADVFLPDGSSPNVLLIRSGHCRWSHHYSSK